MKKLSWDSLTDGISAELQKTALSATGMSGTTQSKPQAASAGQYAPATPQAQSPIQTQTPTTSGKSFGGKALSAAGSGLGVLGAAGQAAEAYGNLQQGNVLGAAVNTAGALGSAAMAAPGSAAKLVGKKALSKFIPGVGAATSGYDAYNRFRQGDYLGGAISGLGAAGSFIPGVGGFASLGADALNAARDLGVGSKIQNFASNTLNKLNPVNMVANKVTETVQPFVEGAKQLAPLGIAMLGQGMMGGGMGGGAQQPAININLGGKKPTMLDYDPTRVSSFSDYSAQDGYKTAHLKKADFVSDALASHAKRKITDNIINQIYTQDKYPQRKEKELELVSRYPGMEKILENPETRDYLKRILS